MTTSDTPMVIRSLAKAELLHAYPYMPVTAIDELLDRFVTDATNVIEKQKPVMAEIKTRVNFFSLPPEIRNTIYELAVTPCVHSNVPEPMVVFTDKSFIPRRTSNFTVPSILHASQQIRREALPIYLGLNHFQITLGKWGSPGESLDAEEIVKWGQMIGKEGATMVKQLKVSIELGYGRDRKEKFGWDLLEHSGATTFHELDPAAPVEEWTKTVMLRALRLDTYGISEDSVVFEFSC